LQTLQSTTRPEKITHICRQLIVLAFFKVVENSNVTFRENIQSQRFPVNSKVFRAAWRTFAAS